MQWWVYEGDAGRHVASTHACREAFARTWTRDLKCGGTNGKESRYGIWAQGGDDGGDGWKTKVRFSMSEVGPARDSRAPCR